MPESPQPADAVAEPAEALSALAQFPGLAIIDLDETLYLRNSTEDFLDGVFPHLPCLLLLVALDVLKPWKLWGGDENRDVWRVRVVRLLFPWAMLTWKRRVKALAASHSNPALKHALASRDAPWMVATLGFRPVVEPLLAAMQLSPSRLVAVSWNGFSDRRQGKLGLLEQTIGAEAVAAALVLTDSLDDAPLLERCASPLLVKWPGARYRRAQSGVYLPGLYLALVKRPGEHYFRRSILQEDFVVWLLGSLTLANVSLAFVVGMTLLLFSFWTIYETGYVDNDQVGARFEESPKLSKTFGLGLVATPAVTPWIWALLTGMAGVWLLSPAERPGLPWEYGAWPAVLVATSLWFRIYNRFDKATRVWMFAGLQFARAAAFIAVVPVTAVGGTAVAAHALARWVPYHVYRLYPAKWPEINEKTMRLLFLTILFIVVCSVAGPGVLFSWTTPAVFGWSIFRARKELVTIVGSARRIDRPVVLMQNGELHRGTKQRQPEH